MLLWAKLGQSSNIMRVKILDSSVSTGAGKTGLAYNTAGLIISVIADVSPSATAYTQAGGTIENITTLGTYAAPTSNKCRFKEVDSTNHKGVYEIQLEDTRFQVLGAKSLLVSISGASNAAECDFVLQLTSVDPYNGTDFGLGALPDVAAGASGGLIINGSNTGTVTLDALTVTNATTLTGAVSATSASNDVRGVKLHSAGLDSISTTAPSGVAANFREMLVALWRRHFKKAVISTTDIKTYADDGTTVVTTQTRSETATTQTQGAAT